MTYSHDGSPLQEYACGPDTSTSAYDQENRTKNVQVTRTKNVQVTRTKNVQVTRTKNVQVTRTKNVLPGLRPGRRARVNRLVGVSGAATATFVYDGDGNRQ